MGEDTKEVNLQEQERYPICRRCHRKLKNPTSQERGMGDICFYKSLSETIRKPLFDMKEGK